MRATLGSIEIRIGPFNEHPNEHVCAGWRNFEATFKSVYIIILQLILIQYVLVL